MTPQLAMAIIHQASVLVLHRCVPSQDPRPPCVDAGAGSSGPEPKVLLRK